MSHEGKPAEFYLPLLMIYTVRYLQALRALTPELYHSEFSPGTENRGTIDLLLQRAETAYRGWAAELEKAGVREPESERNLWDQYLALKAKLVGVASAGPARS